MNNAIEVPILLALDPWIIFFKRWLKQWEGFSNVPYLDSGDLPTILWGVTRYKDGSRVTMVDKAISIENGEAMLDDIFTPYIRTVNSIVLTPISPVRRVALIDFAYNCGETSLALSKLLREINDNPNNPDIRNQFMRWVYCDGKVLKGLVRRRQAEADLYFSEAA